MIWLVLPVALMLCAVLVVLITPFHVVLDSVYGWYGVKFGHGVSVRMLWRDKLVVCLRYGYWNRDFYPFHAKPDSQQPKKKTKTVSNKKAVLFPFGLHMAIAMLKSFRVRTLQLVLDTGDPALNGILFPMFWAVANRWNVNMNINFLGQNKLQLDVENTAGRLLKIFIYHRFIVKNKNKGYGKHQ